MGIQQTKSLLKTYYSKKTTQDPDDYLQKGFSPESLQIAGFLDNFWDTNTNEYFDWTNIQENKKPEEIVKEKEKFLIREKYIMPNLPFNPTITDNLFSIEPLAEIKEAHVPSETKYFSNTFIKRMHIIMIAYVRKILSTLNENSSLDCIAKYFESNEYDESSKVSLEIGLNIFVKLLDQISSKDTKLKEETLNFLLDNSTFLRPLAFWGETKKHFVLDKSLNEIVDYLNKIISDKNENTIFRQKAFKVLINLGLAKGSLKNLLNFVTNYEHINEYIDLNYEINLFKNEFIKLSLSYPSDENIKVNSKLWNFKPSAVKKKEEEESSSEHYSVTNDGNYVYLFSTAGYIAKIGSGYNNTMLGKIYTLKENFKAGERGTIACVENVLYYRSSNLDPNPLLCLDVDDLNEIPLNYEIDTKEPNYLWVETKRFDFEFPDNSHKEMAEIIEKKKNLGTEDKPNVRPSTNSPMITDGRYIYIFSKWYDDTEINMDRGNDDDDDEPKVSNKKTSKSIYGIDIYDPLTNMSHIKSILLKQNKQKENLVEETSDVDLLKADTIYYTNGNIFVVNKTKFNLSTGEEVESATDYTSDLKNCCYDLVNNVIWGISKKGSNTDKPEIYCYFNHSAKPIVEYPENSEKYMACSLEKIIQSVEDLIKLKNYSNQISIKTYLRENTLNILGLEDSQSVEYKKHNIVTNEVNSLDLTIYKKSIQCLILSTIAKLSEYYGQVSDMSSANTDEERGKILAQACRRPYCVKLEPETFECLINFINQFSKEFFNRTSSDLSEIVKLDNYCLLSTLKILRTNLKCLSISNLEIDFFIKNKDNNPFLKVKEFIFKIFEIYHSKNKKEDGDFIKALYEECKIILQVSTNTLYPNYPEIIGLLEREIQNFASSSYSKDIVLCVLEWMSNEENMKNMFLKLSKEEINRIFSIFKIVSSWEVRHFSKFIKNIKTLKEGVKYSHSTNDEIIAFRFSSVIQIEILKQISKKLLNDDYENIELEHLLHNFSTIIFDNVVDIFRDMRAFMEAAPKIIENDWNSLQATEPEEEIVDTSISKPADSEQKKQEELPYKTKEEYSKAKFQEIWNYIVEKVLSNELLILRTFNFHIDCLSILSSNFIISSLMLNSYNSIIEEMNRVYALVKSFDKNDEHQVSDYKEVIFECEHPYPNNQDKWFTLEIPGESEIYLEFDPLSYCKPNCGYVQMYTDTNKSAFAFPELPTNLTDNFPKDPIHCTNSTVHLYFYTDSCINSSNSWGFRVKVHNGKNTSSIKLDNKFTSMLRSVCWVSCKCSAQLLRGNFTKSLTSALDEDDIKYNNILTSKLFAGGIDFEDVRKDNDPLLANIIEIFEDIKPEPSSSSTKSPCRATEKALLNNILNGNNKDINIIIKFFQIKFSKEVVWAYIGGEQADRLVRAAYAALLKHSGQSLEFQKLLDIVELSETTDEEQLCQEVVNNQTFASLYKKWQAASRMRTWLVEKKKNVDEALEKNKTTKTKTKEEEEKSSTETDTMRSENNKENGSEDIMAKIIEQTIIKAKFLIKLNPSPAFTSDDNRDEKTKHNPDLLVRSTSFEDTSKEDSWKTRLVQWKAVQKSKKVLKSVEEEANEKMSSLTSSVLTCLQSAISSKRLFGKIKIATIRAKGREIGLMTIHRIFEIVSHSNVIQDLLAWFCASLRKTETKICHYLDNVNGCGKHFEERIQERFQEFISLLISKLIITEKIPELKSFIDALMWKYSANDHKFLVEQGLFMILWGTYNESIKKSWGKPLKPQYSLTDDNKVRPLDTMDFSNNLLEVFEVVSNICLDRAAIHNDKNKSENKKLAPQVNIKFPSLERQVSIIDDTNSEDLIRHILDVIFGEVVKAIQSYLRTRGISYNLWRQFEEYEEENGDDKKKKADVGTGAVAVSNVDAGHEDFVERSVRNANLFVDEVEAMDRDEEEAETEVRSTSNNQNEVHHERTEHNEEAKKKEEEENVANADHPYYYDEKDLLTLYDELRDLTNKGLNSSKKTFVSSAGLIDLIFKQNAEIYDPDFIGRLLVILYKCSAQQNSDKILFGIANPLNFASLLKLMRICSTQNKILIAKILQNSCSHVPEEILIESVDIFIQNHEGDKFIIDFANKRKTMPSYDKGVFIDLILDIIYDIRSKAWKKDSESTGALIVSFELVEMLRKLWYTEHWNESITALFKRVIGDEEKEYLKKEIILSIFGSDYQGQSAGAKVRLSNDMETQKGINFDFIKSNFTEHFNYGTILGYSANMEDIWVKKSKEDKGKVPKNLAMYLTPCNSVETQTAVLLHDSIIKDEFNLMDVTPKVIPQHELKIVQAPVNYDYLKIGKDSIVPILSYVLQDSSNTSESLNLKSHMMRFVYNYIQSEAGSKALLDLEENYLSDVIAETVKLANKNISYKENYLNLDLLEEYRYRIINFCSETKFNLSEIPKLSICFRNPNSLILRISSDSLFNLCYTVNGALNTDNLSRFGDFGPFSVNSSGENSSIIVSDPDKLEDFISQNRMIITHSTDIKQNEAKLKRVDSCSLIVVEIEIFNEILSLYNDLVNENKKCEEVSALMTISTSRSENSDDLVQDLRNFGFSKELIETEINKSKEALDFNALITNLLEYKEKRQDIEDKTEEEKEEFEKIEKAKEIVTEKEIEEEIEIEAKNECFNTNETNNKAAVPDYFEELLVPEGEDNSLLYKSFKYLNDKIITIYARRIVLNLLVKLLDDKGIDTSKYDNLLKKVPTESIISVLKLLTHEGLFLNSIGWGSDMLIPIKDILIKIYSSNSSEKCKDIAVQLTKSTLSDLETVLNGKKMNYEFISKNEDLVVNKPMIFFSIWNLMIINESSKTKIEYSFIFNVLAGLITKITENKQIRWFIIDLLIQFVTKISERILEDKVFLQNISSEKSIKEVENINKLRIFLDESINKESKKNLSKRSQMICELLIYIEEIYNKISTLSNKVEIASNTSLIESNSKRDNFTTELLTTFEMMKDFFDKKYLKYLAWIEMNPDIINSSKITFESAHLYPKAPHTFLINVPNTTALEVNIHSDTLLDNGDALLFSLDKNCIYPVECFAGRNSKKTFTLNSSHSFVHFPSNYLTEVYGFGSNTYSRLGITGFEIFTPKLIESLSSVLIKDIYIGDTFLMAQAENGELLSCGNGIASGLAQTSPTFVKAANILLPDKINSEGVNAVSVYMGSTIIVTKDHSMYSIGMNTFGQLGQAWTSPVNEITSMSFQKRMKHICIGDTHTMMVSHDGRVYHLGNNDYYQNGEMNASRNNSPKLLDFEKNLYCEMVSIGEYFSIFLMKEVSTGKRKLYASGWAKQGRTGTGSGEEMFGIKAISHPDIENIEFRYITSSKLSSGAVSTTGKLYTWGSNARGQLGLGHYNDVIEPTLVTYFEKYDVEKISMSNEHTLVLAKDIEKAKISVFGFGESNNGKLGETITQKSEKKDTVPTPVKLSFFEGKNPTTIKAGPRCSIIICKLKPYESLRDVHNIPCSLCSKTPIIGNLYIEIGKELKAYCSECIKVVDMSDKSPRLLFKSPLKNYDQILEVAKKYQFTGETENEAESHTNITCSQCTTEIVLNSGAYMYLDNKVKHFLCNKCIDLYPDMINSAKVYLRVFKNYKNIDITNTTNYYDNSVSYGHKFTITPHLNERGCESVIEKHNSGFNHFIEDINEYNKLEVYEQLVDLLNNIAQKAEKSIFTYNPKDLVFKKEDLSVRSSLEKCTSDTLRKMFAILKILNTRVKDLLPFIDFSKVLQNNQRLSYHFNRITPLIFWDTKNEIIEYYLEKTSAEMETSELKLNRMKVRRFIEKGKPDHTGEYTIFGNIYQHVKQRSFKIFKKKEGGNNNKMFNVTFVGEASIDAGGPYREALTQACTELQSSALPLFIPSPNQKNESGLFREKWVVNPSAKSPTHLEMYQCLGGLIGYAMRTGEFLNLDLPSIFWKQILESPVDRKDLELIDRYTIQCLDDIINIHKKGVSAENFSFYVDQKFTTCLSDGSEVEIIAGGQDIELTYTDRVKYCELVEKVRLEESKVQIASIRSGLE